MIAEMDAFRERIETKGVTQLCSVGSREILQPVLQVPVVTSRALRPEEKGYTNSKHLSG